LHETTVLQRLFTKFPTQINREIFEEQGNFRQEQGNLVSVRKRPFSHTLVWLAVAAICSHRKIFRWKNEMSSVRERYGEAFWRAHHEAWVQSELNQREYCEAYGIPLKAFGNWRAKFKAEPQLPAQKGALSARRPKSCP